MTQEFHISVTPVGNDKYLVRTERVAPGVPLAEEQMVWPVEDWLAQAGQLMNDPLLGLLQNDRINLPAGARLPQAAGDFTNSDLMAPPFSLVELGQELYSALFQGTLWDSWVIAQGIAQNRREALRLRLGVKGFRLPRLPWEVMYGTDIPAERLRQRGGVASASHPLATGIHVIFSRYQPGTRLVEDTVSLLTEADQPLRILMVVAAPTDQEQLKLHREINQLQQELLSQSAAFPDGFASTTPDMQLTILDQPGREQLTQALEQGRYQVLHYAGHSDLGTAGGSLYLVNSQTGLTEVLSGDDLAGLLVNNGIRLAVFNSCRGAYTATVDPASGQDRNLAEALVSRGIPAVLAMAEQIPDNVALNLTWLFYRNLKLGYPIDLSLNRARQGLISAYGSHQLYWALPVLYLHPEFDGYLTPGDRTFDNPADRLTLVPQSYSTPAILPTESALPPLTLLTEEAVAEDKRMRSAMLPEDNLGEWTDDLDYEESDQEDALLIADIIQQLTPPLPNPNPLTPNSDTFGSATEAQPPEDALQPAVNPATMALLNQQRESDNGPTQTLVQPSVGTSNASRSASPQATAGAKVPGRRGKSSRASSRKRQRQRLVLPLLGAGVVSIALLGFQYFPQLWTGESLSNLFSSRGSNTEEPGPPSQMADINQMLPPSKLKTIAIDHFNQKEIAEAEELVKVLLERNALGEAAEVLKAVPTAHKDDAAIHFLQGRLVWQAMKQGNTTYSIADARRHWESAASAEPNTFPYTEALGFAHYAEGSPEKAIQAWDAVFSNPKDMSKDVLSAYAGIALALRQAAQNQPAEQKEKYLSKATQLYQMVINKDSADFQPQALSQNWLWTDSAIKDWQALAPANP